MAEKILNTTGTNNVPFVAEPSDHPDYGGAAVITMTLTCDKVQASGLPTLDLLHTEAQGRNTETTFWYIDPDGMEKTLMPVTRADCCICSTFLMMWRQRPASWSIPSKSMKSSRPCQRTAGCSGYLWSGITLTPTTNHNGSRSTTHHSKPV